ncbi:MAG: carbonic anhydrase family protein [Planctomycetota bacterium]
MARGSARVDPPRGNTVRRYFMKTLPCGAMALSLAALSVCAVAEPPSRDVVTAKEQAAMTPARVLAELKAGNERFVAGDSTDQDWLAQAKTTAAEGQFPKAIVLSCLDSRVPVEIVFDKGIGDIFVGRVAGNFENVDMLGSFEFGTAVAGSKVIVVLGHTACGAVKGAMAGAELGNLTATLDNIEPAIADAGGSVSADNDSDVTRVVEANVRRTMTDLTARSEVLAGLVEEGKLIIAGGVYDLATGQVNWITN